jgi:hypothetical protein
MQRKPGSQADFPTPQPSKKNLDAPLSPNKQDAK